jgi:hypothetical protein
MCYVIFIRMCRICSAAFSARKSNKKTAVQAVRQWAKKEPNLTAGKFNGKYRICHMVWKID